jgi:hypothetical protein
MKLGALSTAQSANLLALADLERQLCLVRDQTGDDHDAQKEIDEPISTCAFS